MSSPLDSYLAKRGQESEQGVCRECGLGRREGSDIEEREGEGREVREEEPE